MHILICIYIYRTAPHGSKTCTYIQYTHIQNNIYIYTYIHTYIYICIHQGESNQLIGNQTVRSTCQSFCSYWCEGICRIYWHMCGTSPSNNSEHISQQSCWIFFEILKINTGLIQKIGDGQPFQWHFIGAHCDKSQGFYPCHILRKTPTADYSREPLNYPGIHHDLDLQECVCKQNDIGGPHHDSGHSKIRLIKNGLSHP